MYILLRACGRFPTVSVRLELLELHCDSNFYKMAIKKKHSEIDKGGFIISLLGGGVPSMCLVLV